METWTERHAELVAATAPVVDGASADELARAWSRVEEEVAAAPRVRRRHLRVVAGSAIAAAVVGVSGYAAAGVLSAHTGRGPADNEDLVLGGPGERLDPAGSDFREAIENAIGDIRFPSAASRQVSIDDHVHDFQRDHPAPRTTGVSTGAIRAWTAVHAVCAWSNEWVKAQRSGDQARVEAAATMLVEARHWPAITDLDPVQKTSMLTQDVLDRETGETRTETIPDPTQFYYLRLVSDAVEKKDVDALAAALADNAYCIGPSLVPDFLQALPAGFRAR